MKSSNQSNLTFNHNTSTLTFIYDYEFKKLHKLNLKKYRTTASSLKRISMSTQFNKFKKVEPITPLNIPGFLLNYKKNDLMEFFFNKPYTGFYNGLGERVNAEQVRNIRIADLMKFCLEHARYNLSFEKHCMRYALHIWYRP